MMLPLLLPALAAAGGWCPRFHTIANHYDPSGPILVDGLWHVFPDGCCTSSNALGCWCHYTSPDLLRWTAQAPLSQVGNGDTGSISITSSGGPAIALFPALVPGQHQRIEDGFLRQSSLGGGLSPNVTWSPPVHVAKRPPQLDAGFRDPARALLLDGSWYVGVGSGFGAGDNNTSPSKGVGCLAWMKASNASLSAFEYAGCLLEVNSTTGSIDGKTVSWREGDQHCAFFECPDIFPLGDGDKYVGEWSRSLCVSFFRSLKD